MSNIKGLICQEIERRIQSYKTKNGFPSGTISAIRIETYEGLRSFITALPKEKPSEDLEEAADNHIRNVVDAAGHPGWDWTTQDIADAFIAGAEWQKSHLTVEDIKTILDLSFWNNDPEKILEEYNRICDTSKVTRR